MWEVFNIEYGHPASDENEQNIKERNTKTAGAKIIFRFSRFMPSVG